MFLFNHWDSGCVRLNKKGGYILTTIIELTQIVISVLGVIIAIVKLYYTAKRCK